MELVRKHILNLQIDNESDVGVCRRKSVGLAKQMGFDEVKTGEVAILVTELVTNVLKHGGGIGKILVCELENESSQKAIEVWCCDKGNGFPDLEKAITDGYTESTTLGIGLGSIRRFSDEFEINPKSLSDLNGLELYSHCIRSVKWLPSKKYFGSNSILDIGAVSIAKPGEKLNGDCFVIHHISATKTIVAVIDGLGHGKNAHIASQLAKEQIVLKPNLPVDALLKHIHNSIRGTRGAVIGIAGLDTENNKISFTGIGNIEGFLLTSEGKKNLLSFGGIIGHNMRTPRVFTFDFHPSDILCLYSDGITTRWNTDDINWREHPQSNAEYIYNNYSRQNDDATILILRHNS